VSAKINTFKADPQVAKDNLKGALDKLKAGLEGLVSSPQNFQRHLTFTVRGNLHKYSFRNQILIWMQCPDAFHVGGYHYWIKRGRRPIAGAGCRILAPSMFKKKVTVDPNDPAGVDAIAVTDDDGTTTYQIEKVMRSYRTVVVWDISATKDAKGNPYTGGGPVNDPALVGSDEEDERAADLDKECRKFATSLGATVLAEDDPTSYGSFTPSTNVIRIGTRKSPLRVCKTSIHETAHFMEEHLGTREGYNLGELVAESVAFVTLQRYGLDTSEYSFKYIAGYGGDPRMLQKGLTAIQKIATAIIAGLEADDEPATTEEAA
jgi:hypothetical protein